MKAKLSAYQVDLEKAEKFEELVHDNQWFSHVSLGLNVGDRLQSDTRPKREVLGQLCTTLFDITRRSYFESPTRYVEADSHAPIRRQQLDLVSIWTHEQSRSEWEALCSAAILGQTTRKLELTHVERPWYSKRWDSKRWEWLAYAFFSKRVRSSLEVLALNRIKHMGTEEMEAFCAVLSSENPEAVLLGCPDGLASIQDAILAADSPIRWDFDEQGEPIVSSDALKVASPIPFLRITSGSEEIEWVDAIVPGYGRCQVQRENLVLIEEVDVIPGKNLKALEVHFTKWSLFNRTPDIRGLPLFLAAVGPSLKTLTIDTGDVLVDVKMVLERCPNLEKFCLMRQKDVAVLNFSDYHAAGSPLPAITINLDGVPAFAEEMMNTDSALANCLQRLTIHQGFRWSTNPELEPMLEALLKMLESNDHLEYLCVNFFYEYEEEYADRFWKFHLQPINRSVKLDIESKTAFLSVLLKTSLPQNEQRKSPSTGK